MAIGLFDANTPVIYTEMNPIIEKVNENEMEIGNLSTLTTTEKTNLVGATNELNSSKANTSNPAFVGTMTLNGKEVAIVESFDLLSYNIGFLNGWGYIGGNSGYSKLERVGNILCVDLSIAGGAVANGTVILDNLPYSVEGILIGLGFTSTVNQFFTIEAIGKQIKITGTDAPSGAFRYSFSLQLKILD